MQNSFFKTAAQPDPDVASRPKTSEATNCDGSGEAALPPWVSKHEPLVSKNPKPEFAARQRHKSIGTNPSVAPLSQSAKLLTVSEAAWLLNLSEKTIRRMIEAGNLAVIRLGRSVRSHPEVIEKIMCQNE